MSEPASEPAFRFTGGCQCGAVRYAVSENPTNASICHCRMCQKASGGPYMVFGRVPLTAVTWTRGSQSTFQSSNAATRGFCARCGTPLTFQWRSDAISFTIGSFDDPTAFSPESRLGFEALLPWSEHIAELPIVKTDDWMEPAARSRFINHQHPDHDT